MIWILFEERGPLRSSFLRRNEPGVAFRLVVMINDYANTLFFHKYQAIAATTKTARIASAIC